MAQGGEETERPAKRMRLDNDDVNIKEEDSPLYQSGNEEEAGPSEYQSPPIDENTIVRHSPSELDTQTPGNRYDSEGLESRHHNNDRQASEASGPGEPRRDPTIEHSPTAPPTPRQEIKIQYRPKLILRGHKAGVSAVKFSPDGRWIASSSADATIKIWDSVSGKHSQTLEGHLAGISAIAWSPDSKTLASGSDDKSIRLWDINSGKPHPTPLLGHHNYVYSLCFSPKGNMLVSGSHDESVILWNVRSARLMRSLPAHSDPVGGVDFVHDGTLIVSCASDGLIRIWDTATGQCLRTLVHEDNPPVVSVRFSPNGRYVLAWTLDSCVRLWDYVEGRCVKTYQGHVNIKYSLAGCFFARKMSGGEEADGGGGDGREKAFIVSGSEDGCLVVWDVGSKSVVQRIMGESEDGGPVRGHDGVVLGVDSHPTGEGVIVSCGLDKTVRVWRDDGAL